MCYEYIFMSLGWEEFLDKSYKHSYIQVKNFGLSEDINF